MPDPTAAPAARSKEQDRAESEALALELIQLLNEEGHRHETALSALLSVFFQVAKQYPCCTLPAAANAARAAAMLLDHAAPGRNSVGLASGAAHNAH